MTAIESVIARTVTQAAPAKINLSLHVTGQRGDGYHLLDSIVMFTDLGDEISVTQANALSLTIVGPFAKGLLADDTNLVLRAARSFGTNKGAAITLTKNLPVASGIGGGSADAAATLRALAELWDVPLPDLDSQLALGADVPVCMSAALTRMRGIGEQIETFGPAPLMDTLLVNPCVPVSTAQVFDGLARKDNAPMADDMPDPFDTAAWLDWLAAQRNDLEDPARDIAPVIGQVLDLLRAQPGCHLSRMSGSGATCFAIFESDIARDAAAAVVREAYPDWWVAQTEEATI